MQGSLHEHVIISVPMSSSHRSIHALSDKLIKEFDRPVVIVTHNINFMKLDRLSKEEAKAVTERVTSRVVEEKLALAQFKALEVGHVPTQESAENASEAGVGDIPEKVLDDGANTDGDGSGPGLRLDRGDNFDQASAGDVSSGEVGQGDSDKKVGQETPE